MTLAIALFKCYYLSKALIFKYITFIYVVDLTDIAR